MKLILYFTTTSKKSKEVFNIEKKQYDFAKLSHETIEQIRLLEKRLCDEVKEEVILIAYENNSK